MASLQLVLARLRSTTPVYCDQRVGARRCRPCRWVRRAQRGTAPLKVGRAHCQVTLFVSLLVVLSVSSLCPSALSLQPVSFAIVAVQPSPLVQERSDTAWCGSKLGYGVLLVSAPPVVRFCGKRTSTLEHELASMVILPRVPCLWKFLVGVCVLPAEHRNAWLDSGYMYMRQV